MKVINYKENTQRDVPLKDIHLRDVQLRQLKVLCKYIHNNFNDILKLDFCILERFEELSVTVFYKKFKLPTNFFITYLGAVKTITKNGELTYIDLKE